MSCFVWQAVPVEQHAVPAQQSVPQIMGVELVHPHFPPEQAWVSGQGCPHAPQFAASLARSLHTPEQLVCPAGQQMPLEQVGVATVQAFPHAPQFAASVALSTHPMVGPQLSGNDALVQAQSPPPQFARG